MVYSLLLLHLRRLENAISTAFIVQFFASQAIYFLQGYWPKWMSRLRLILIARKIKKLRQAAKLWQAMARHNNTFSSQDRLEFVKLDVFLQSTPNAENIMPTKFGNILKSAENRISSKYGLDASICLPRLWLLLPEVIRQTLQETKFNLEEGARIWIWGALFIILGSAFSWWPSIVGLLVMYLAYLQLLNTAGEFGSLLESIFDVYRLELYKAMHWPLPVHPSAERELGSQLTQYLWRGPARHQPKFQYDS